METDNSAPEIFGKHCCYFNFTCHHCRIGNNKSWEDLEESSSISVAFDWPVPGKLTNMIYNLVAITINNSDPILLNQPLYHSLKISQNTFTLLL